MFARLRRWLRTWWLTVPTPREISMVYTVVYVIVGVTGVFTLLIPPEPIQHVAEPVTTAGVGVFFILGAIVAGIGGYREHWQFERAGLLLVLGALAGYAVLMLALHSASLGYRLMHGGIILIALAVFVLRWLMIRSYTYRPGR